MRRINRLTMRFQKQIFAVDVTQYLLHFEIGLLLWSWLPIAYIAAGFVGKSELLCPVKQGIIRLRIETLCCFSQIVCVCLFNFHTLYQWIIESRTWNGCFTLVDRDKLVLVHSKLFIEYSWAFLEFFHVEVLDIINVEIAHFILRMLMLTAL